MVCKLHLCVQLVCDAAVFTDSLVQEPLQEHLIHLFELQYTLLPRVFLL